MDSLLSAAEAVADTASSTLSSVAFSAWSSYHRNRPVEQGTDRIPKRPIGSETEWNSRASSPLATTPIASSSSSSSALSPGGPTLSEQGGLNSWSSSWLPAVRSGETSELRFRGMTKEEIDQLLWDHRTIFTAGTASLISTAASFPFDSLKSRLQVKYYPSIWNCAKAVFREEGIGGFFRGVFIPLITISFVRTSSFSIYVNTKDRLHEAGKLKDKSRLRDVALSGMAGGATSGVIISCGSAPFELVKVQRQLEYLTAVQKGLIGSGSASSSTSSSSSSAKPTPSAPKFKAQSGFTAAADILKSHGGIKGFYIGFPLHLCRDTLGTALYFGSYDTIRALVTRNTSPNGSLYGIPGPVVSFLSGSTAGIASWLIVYPVDLVKTNVQQRTLSHHPQQMTGYQLFLSLLKERPPPSKSGFHDTSLKRFLRLYRGLGVSALRSFISHGLTWTIIESLSDKISKRTGKDVMAARG